MQPKVAERRTSRGGRGCLLLALLGMILLAVVYFVGPHVFRALWDGWADLHVHGVVTDPSGRPIAGARVTVILHPGSPGYQLLLDSVDKADAPRTQQASKPDPERSTRRETREIGISTSGALGRIDLMLGYHTGGSSDEPAVKPPYGGMMALIVEAEGYETAYESARSGKWRYDSERGSDGRLDSVGSLDLGQIVLQPKESGDPAD